MCAERGAPELGATSKVTVADPEPAAGPETVIHSGRLEMVQAQPASVVRVRGEFPPAAEAWSDLEETE
jgi:hypothetical protein